MTALTLKTKKNKKIKIRFVYQHNLILTIRKYILDLNNGVKRHKDMSNVAYIITSRT